MAKVYFPTYSRDIMINNGKQLQVQGTTAKTMADCSVGDIVKLPEINGGVKAYQQYILCEKTSEYIVLLRKVTAAQGYHSSADPNNWWYWCTNTFYNRFSDVAKAQITTKNVDGTNRSVYILNRTEANTYFASDGARIAYNSGGTAVRWWLRDTSGQYRYFVETSGTISNRQETNTIWYRPAVVFLPNTPLNADNEYEDEITYTDTIATIKMGTDTYKIKDMDARGLIEGKQDELTAGAGIDITGSVISVTGIVEKVLELDVDYGTLLVAQVFGNGDEVILVGNQIASGGLLYNARVTGIEGYINGQWSNIYSVYAAGNLATVPSIPFVLNDGTGDFTIVAYTDGLTGIVDTATKVRIHYIEIAGTEVVTND